jgi:hypothetical protein
MGRYNSWWLRGLSILCRESIYTRFSAHRHLLMSETRVNAKTGSSMRFNLHVNSDVRGFTWQTNSSQTFNCNAQNCHDIFNTYLLLIQFHNSPCPSSNNNCVYVIELNGPVLKLATANKERTYLKCNYISVVVQRIIYCFHIIQILQTNFYSLLLYFAILRS